MLSNLYKKLIKSYHKVAVIMFLAFEIYLHFFIHLYGDDYYYASFFKEGFRGFIYLTKLHYIEVNGRAFIHMLNEIMLLAGPYVWRIFNPIIIIVISILIAKIASRYYRIDNLIDDEKRNIKNFYKKSVVVSILLFSVLNIWITRQSVYWITGSFNYLFPVMLLMLFFYLYKKDIYNNKGYKWLWTLAFLSAFTVEQAGLVAVLINVYILFDIWLKKIKINKIYILNLICSIAAYATVICAPGNSLRTTYYAEFYKNSLIRNVLNNIPNIFDTVFLHKGIYVYIMLMLLCIINIVLDPKTFSNISKLYKVFIALVFSTLLVAYIDIMATNALRILNHVTLLTILLWTLVLSILYFLYLCFLEYKNEKNGDLFFFLLMCICTQGAMLISPIFGPRNVLICALCLFVPLTYYIVRYHKNINFLVLVASIIMTSLFNWNSYLLIAVLVLVLIGYKALSNKQITISISILCVLLCFKYFNQNIQGYKENAEIHKYNAEQVKIYKELNRTDTLRLKYLKNDIYKWTMPYDDPYHMKRYKILNDIDIETEIKFE